MSNTRLSVYTERLNQLSEKRSSLKNSSRLVGWVRLFVFIALVYILIATIVPLHSPLIFLGSVLAGIVIFIIPLAYHQKLFDQIAFTESMIRVNEFELNRNQSLFSD